MNLEKRKIQTPSPDTFSHWPEKPYRWMLNDLIRSIRDADANYLVGLGLFCYTEIVGREIMKYLEPQKNWNTSRTNKICFNKFLGEYMGYTDLLMQYPDLYDWFRNGFCHGYMIKTASYGKSGVYHYFSDADIDKFQSEGVNTSRGILIAKNTQIRILVIEPYLKDFKGGIEKFLKESGQI